MPTHPSATSPQLPLYAHGLSVTLLKTLHFRFAQIAATRWRGGKGEIDPMRPRRVVHKSSRFRGRDVHCWTPPAQIRTSPIRASGSYLGGVTAKRRSGACRTRSSAWVTRARLWVRCVLCWSAFPLVPALGSTASAADVPALFDDFTATMAESDFS